MRGVQRIGRPFVQHHNAAHHNEAPRVRSCLALTRTPAYRCHCLSLHGSSISRSVCCCSETCPTPPAAHPIPPSRMPPLFSPFPFTGLSTPFVPAVHAPAAPHCQDASSLSECADKCAEHGRYDSSALRRTSVHMCLNVLAPLPAHSLARSVCPVRPNNLFV